MLDPFFQPPNAWKNTIQPVADFLGLATLPLHLHEVLFAWACYHIIFIVISPYLSSRLLPESYPSLSKRTKISWNVHVTSFIQSSIIVVLSLYVILNDGERKDMDWVGRIWGYTGAGGLTQGLAAGYFLWDLVISIQYLDVLGAGSLAHAISALLVTGLGFRPFANYYGLNFVLYEISTPFLNIHWFFDKLHWTGSRAQLYNGILLLATFFSARVLWGNYQSFRIYSDVWTALHTSNVQMTNKEGTFLHAGMNTIEASGNLSLPTWLVLTYLGSNTILNFLNIYWFAKMIQALRKRFTPTVSDSTGGIAGKVRKPHAD